MEQKGEKRSNGEDAYLEYNPTKQARLEETILKISSQNTAVKSKPDMKVVGRSSVLDNVKKFLPDFKKSTLELEKQALELGTDELDIENVDCCENVIEFDLSLVPSLENGGEISKALHDFFAGKEESSDSDTSSESGTRDAEVEKKNLIEEI